ncbi:BatD family protein [Flavobacteriaceae bacterium 3-367]
MRYPYLLLFVLASFYGRAQSSPSVHSEIDTTFIKIGEQIKYTITVETDSTDLVFFPEGQTFSPLETVEAFATDTTRKKNRLTLQKIYALTQFDSGVYTIPPQRIAINEKPFFTDSVKINVATVPVDTLTQKMYDIKSLIPVEKSYSRLWKVLLIILLGLLLVGGLLYWFVFRKKPLTEEEKEALLPPYDRALLELKRLENSKYLIQDEYKRYYSELTDIVRSYLEEDVHVTALESTTNQLIDKLEMLKDAGELKLEDDTIHQFKRILQTADLVKFAKSKPPTSTAEQDRKSIEEIVIKTKEALPEPTEEELMQQQEYQEELARKKYRKKIVIAVAATVALLLISAVSAVSYYGFNQVKDTVLGHPTKELLDGEWVSSSYGYPPISLETPKVLIRQDIPLPAEARENIKEQHNFIYTSSIGLFTVATSSTSFTELAEPDFEKSIEQLLKNFEDQGAKNIITKQEEFTTTTGVTGIKTYGSGKFAVPDSKELVRGKYIILSFGGKGFQQQILLSWLDNDSYAEQIVARILRSVEVKTEA